MPSLILSRNALFHNVRKLRQKAGDRKIMAVIKADAYGYGLIEAYRDLINCPDINGFAVSSFSDALTLSLERIPKTKPIFVLSPVLSKGTLTAASYNGVILSIANRDHMDTVINFVKTNKVKQLKIWVEMRTTLNRFGCTEKDLTYLMNLVKTDFDVSSGLLVLGAYSQPSSAGTDTEVFKYDNEWVPLAKELGLETSCSNSSALLSEDLDCDWVRPGVALFGNTHIAKNVPNGQHYALEQTQMLVADVLAVNRVIPGQVLGYGSPITITKPSVFAVLDAGYSNGIPVDFKTNKMRVIDKEGNLKTLGKGSVFMNQMVVDAGNCPDIKPGDSVVLYGDRDNRADVVAYNSNTDVNALTVGAYYSSQNRKYYDNKLVLP